MAIFSYETTCGGTAYITSLVMKSRTLEPLYEQMVRDDSTAIYRLAFRLCGNQDIAEELTQETFYEAWKSIGSLKNPASSRSWLVSILRHRYCHWLRSQKRHPEAPIERTDMLNIFDSRVRVQRAPAMELLQDELDRLDTGCRESFALYLEGYKCRKIAELLDLPLGTVLNRIYRTRIALQARLSEELAGLNLPGLGIGGA